MIGSSGAGPLSLGVGIFLLCIGMIVLWFIVGTAATLKGTAMEPSNRLAQMYGYTVCLVALVTALASSVSILDAAFDRAHPLQTEFPFGASLVSFEAYKATTARERMMLGPAEAAKPDTSSEATLRKRYDALVEERMAATVYRTSKTFITSGIMLVIAGTLFFGHWRWVRRQAA